MLYVVQQVQKAPANNSVGIAVSTGKERQYLKFEWFVSETGLQFALNGLFILAFTIVYDGVCIPHPG